MFHHQIIALAIVTALVGAVPLWAQGTEIAFGGLKGDTSLPIEVKSDQLAINQTNGEAVFSGNVLVTQGEMRLSAGSIRVQYGKEAGQIEKLYAKGRVLLVNANDAAESDSAVYSIDSGQVVMTGNVLLTQGPAAMASNRLVVNLKTGLGRLEGGVTTTFKPKEN